jgi:osmotically-inducible protein OsmY
MWHKEVFPDKSINQRICQQLSSRGMRSPCHIAVQTAKGVVTLTGSIEYEHQRNAAVLVARHMDGVKHVVDQLQVKAKTTQWK